PWPVRVRARLRREIAGACSGPVPLVTGAALAVCGTLGWFVSPGTVSMQKTVLSLALAAAVGMTMTACDRNDAPSPTAGADAGQAAAAAQENPFLSPSGLPLQYPPFDLVRDEHFGP